MRRIHPFIYHVFIHLFFHLWKAEQCSGKGRPTGTFLKVGLCSAQLQVVLFTRILYGSPRLGAVVLQFYHLVSHLSPSPPDVKPGDKTSQILHVLTVSAIVQPCPHPTLISRFLHPLVFLSFLTYRQFSIVAGPWSCFFFHQLWSPPPFHHDTSQPSFEHLLRELPWLCIVPTPSSPFVVLIHLALFKVCCPH